MTRSVNIYLWFAKIPVGHQKWHRSNFTRLPTSGNDGEDRPAGKRTRFGFERENGFRWLVRPEYFCSGQCEFGLDGSKQSSRAQAGDNDTHSAE